MQWKNHLFIPIQNRNKKLAGALYRQIEKQRLGEEIDTSLIKQVVNSFGPLPLLLFRPTELVTNRVCFVLFSFGIGSLFGSYSVSLGLDLTDQTRTNLDVYREHFEKPFIESTRAFYKAESEAFVATHSVSDYLKKTEERLKEEEERVERYLHGDTRKIVRSFSFHWSCSKFGIGRSITSQFMNIRRSSTPAKKS